jgi:hypothetical protein
MTIRHINAIQMGSTRQARLQGNQTADALNQQVGNIADNTGDLGSLQTQVTALQQGPFITGTFVSGTSPGTANTEFAITHNLGRIPQGYFVGGVNPAGTLYQLAGSGTAWTTTQIFVKCTVATVSFEVYIT